jgi:hypothetical protein
VLEISAVAPRCKLGSQRLADSYQIRSFADSRESNLISRAAKNRSAKLTLAFLDCFPSLFERREVPSAAPRANRPQSSLRRIEREPAADREMFYRLILTET